MKQFKKVNVDEAAGARPEYWSQEVLAEANGDLFKAARGIGSTNWHSHEDQDEVFLVTSGELIVELRDGEVVLSAGDLFVVPRGVEHRPRANEEVRFLLVGRGITSTEAGGKPAWSYESQATPES